MPSACCTKRKRHLEASVQQRLFMSSSYKSVTFQGTFSSDKSRVDRHAGCRPAASASQRPEWNDSTRVSAPVDKFCRKETYNKTRAFAKAARKTGQDADARVKTDTMEEATKSPRTSGLLAFKLPDFSFLFKPVCFSPDCSDVDRHFQAWPQKKARKF
ncbi:uncharacterized protein LOC119454015 [Dermacentor silvarum]|uniref:uncharacterized protein LOC119454015 n=1 Tax=Dermacentor silvarum TaxID=543639 RepID=UPI0021007920|nr:uncharacterized protein LOC119454015 [Dermacentor silvarum]